MSLERIREKLAREKAARDEEKLVFDVPEEPVQIFDYDTVPRLTVKALLEHPREVEFAFKTEPYGGEAYIGAMRSVLSRARKDLKRAGKKPREFKLFLVSIEHTETHDLVTVLRTEKHRSLLHKSVYEDLMGELTDEL